MNSDAVVAVSAAVVAAVQLSKWAGLEDRKGPIAVILFSVLGVSLWLLSSDHWPPDRVDTWPITSGILAVVLSAAGVFGFTRAASTAITSTRYPANTGAGSSATVDSPREGSVVEAGWPVIHKDPTCMSLAFISMVPAADGEVLDEPGDVRHLDGRPWLQSDSIVCDTCQGALQGAEPVGGVWYAKSVGH